MGRGQSRREWPENAGPIANGFRNYGDHGRSFMLLKGMRRHEVEWWKVSPFQLGATTGRGERGKAPFPIGARLTPIILI